MLEMPCMTLSVGLKWLSPHAALVSPMVLVEGHGVPAPLHCPFSLQ
jgi:hypothetical protein